MAKYLIYSSGHTGCVTKEVYNKIRFLITEILLKKEFVLANVLWHIGQSGSLWTGGADFESSQRQVL